MVKGAAGWPVVGILREVADGAPAGLVEGVAEGEPAAADQLGIPLNGVYPQPGLQGGVGEPADTAEGRGGEPGAPRGPASAGQRGGAPAQEGVDVGGEARPPDSDLPVAFDEGDDDV